MPPMGEGQSMGASDSPAKMNPQSLKESATDAYPVLTRGISNPNQPCQCTAMVNEEWDAAEHIEALEQTFPRCVPEPVLIDHMTKVLEKHGFTASTSINLVSTCRDEICRPFTEYLDDKWGTPSFNISSLAGMVFCGRTGFKAAMAHAPVVDGKERYVFWVAPHTALSGDNVHGKVWRPGRSKASSACGALLAVLSQIKDGRVNVQMDPGDIEMSLLKQHVVSYLKYGHEPTLPELTYAVHECIHETVKSTAAAAVDLDNCEYVIISGIQIHSGFSKTMFWPGSIKKYTSAGVEDLYEQYAESVAEWHGDGTDEFVAAEALAALQLKERTCRIAARKGDLATLEEVQGIKLNAVHDHHMKTLLHVAAIEGKAAVAQMLADKFATEDPTFIQSVDVNHRTALEYAVSSGHDDVAKILVDRGAGLSGEFLSDLLVSTVRQGDVETLNKLVWYAAKGEEAVKATRDSDGRPLVHIASKIADKSRRKQMLETLLSFGCEVDKVDFFGNDDLARSESVQQQMTALLEAGGPAHVPSK